MTALTASKKQSKPKHEAISPPLMDKDLKHSKIDTSSASSAVSSDITLSEGEKLDTESQSNHLASNESNQLTGHVVEQSTGSTAFEPQNVADENKTRRSPTPSFYSNSDSFFYSFLKIKPVMVLPRVKELGIAYGDPTPYPITPFILADHLGGNEKKAEHVLKYALAAEGTNLYNLFSIQTRNFRYHIVNQKNDSRKIVRSLDNADASFYLIGRVTHCNLESGEYNKEIDIQPLGRLWPRCVAAISQILKFRNPHFNVYKDRLIFSSYCKPQEGQKEPSIKPVAMDGITHGPPIRGWNHEVPMFSGIQKFALTHYPTLPEAPEFHPGDYALVVFTVGGYRTQDNMERVLLNVQLAIVLENHADSDAQAPYDSFYEDFGDETPIGVDDTTMMGGGVPEVVGVPVSELPAGTVM
ncbi:hypothetical protein ARMSODRAFT_1022092 [Armillaria solidipes]|uniref:Uncharacterized protein n=1 Tax=Armillaria solidipes TaxID=1076256 RepID=A0A2H3B7I5_9AGAR|nr:hypothetical protein ARMSODRAFT_1022092 [Armillaria solidipes]